MYRTCDLQGVVVTEKVLQKREKSKQVKGNATNGISEPSGGRKKGGKPAFQSVHGKRKFWLKEFKKISQNLLTNHKKYGNRINTQGNFLGRTI